MDRPEPIHTPRLDDAEFVAALLPTSGQLQAGKQACSRGDLESARRKIVEHFVSRSRPRFFCDYTHIATMAGWAQAQRPESIQRILTRVDSDIRLGLRVMATRTSPVGPAFDWMHTPLGPGHDDLFRAQPFRFGFMPRFALAAHYGVATPELIQRMIDSWIATTRAGNVESFHSPLLVTYRVIALTWTFAYIAGLGDHDSQAHTDLLFSILKILWTDAAYLHDVIGDSYPNNHLLADGFIGWYIGTLYPEFAESTNLLSKGSEILEGELPRQFYSDGANFEHSIHYHELGCEMACAYLILSRRNGIEMPRPIEDRVARMLAFQCALTGPECVPLPIGDSTEDPLFPLDAAHGLASGALRELYRAMFDARIAPAPRGDTTLERAYWMLGGDMAAPARISAEPLLPVDFDLGGVFVLADPALDARLTFRGGPSANTPISAGHAHADLLSVYLSVAGIPIVVNSGTYTYRLKSSRWPSTAPNWRAYFAGPAAHNGLIIGEDPLGPMQGDFRNRDVPCRVEKTRHARTPELSWVECRVTGDNSSRGWRRGIVHVVGRYWIVYDLLPEPSGENQPQIALQFAPSARVTTAAGNIAGITLAATKTTLVFSKSLEQPRLLYGELNPIGGWVSPRYGELEAAPQLRACMLSGYHYCAFVLSVDCDRNAAPIVITDERASTDHIALKLITADHEDCVSIPLASEPTTHTAWNIQFAAGLHWIRRKNGAVLEQRHAQTTLTSG